MSSIHRSFSQIPARGKYFYVPVTSNHGGFTEQALASNIVSDNNLVLSNQGTILNVSDASEFIGDLDVVQINAGEVYRDMGKEVRVLENGSEVALFRLCQLVSDNGDGYEGVPSVPNIFICTWQAYGLQCPAALAMTKVVRTG